MLEQENEAVRHASTQSVMSVPKILDNGDTLKQLLVRSRHLLFKSKQKWTPGQYQRAKLLFDRYPVIKQAYELSQKQADIYRTCRDKKVAFKKRALWYNEVEQAGLDSFKTVARAIDTHYTENLNFFLNRSTNASAESFNGKTTIAMV